jgi:alpha-D-xyloside xylohydrolase
VQDWQYWVANQWGSHQFDATRYPDPAGLVNAIHDNYHARLMISVWPKFYTSTANDAALNARNFTGHRRTRRCSPWVSMLGGWTRPSPKSSKVHSPASPRR